MAISGSFPRPARRPPPGPSRLGASPSTGCGEPCGVLGHGLAKELGLARASRALAMTSSWWRRTWRRPFGAVMWAVGHGRAVGVPGSGRRGGTTRPRRRCPAGVAAVSRSTSSWSRESFASSRDNLARLRSITLYARSRRSSARSKIGRWCSPSDSAGSRRSSARSSSPCSRASAACSRRAATTSRRSAKPSRSSAMRSRSSAVSSRDGGPSSRAGIREGYRSWLPVVGGSRSPPGGGLVSPARRPGAGRPAVGGLASCPRRPRL